MKMLSQFFAMALIAFLFFGDINYAQSDDQPMLVVSSNMVPMTDMGKVNKMVDSIFAPLLKELVDEGFIFSFGHFTHLWGDEWNSNFWYVAKDMASFEKFWDEYVKRGSTRHPGAFASTTKYFQAHKDNIYTIRNQYPAPPKR
ncbi:MAG: hypothetical protein HXY50_01335 [Ignavibacteriaceae bacterium]|nr:hypothetical protein [Ignavibacteriaceae bacterium]